MDNITIACVEVAEKALEANKMSSGEIVATSIVGGLFGIPFFVYWCYLMYCLGVWSIRAGKDYKLNG